MRPIDPADQAAAHPEAVEATGAGLRAALRAVASPVVVVTAASVDGPRGATIGSFTSVALDPPLVSFYVTQGTRFHDALRASERVAVHLLEAGQARLAARFAVPDLDSTDQFDGVAHHVAPGEPPLLAGTLGVLHGTVARRVPLADHTLVLVRVERIVPGVAGEPLLYYQQSYRGVGQTVG